MTPSPRDLAQDRTASNLRGAVAADGGVLGLVQRAATAPPPPDSVVGLQRRPESALAQGRVADCVEALRRRTGRRSARYAAI